MTDLVSLQLRQGVVEEWNAATGDNAVLVAGSKILNMPALTSESASLKAGDVVAILSTEDRSVVLGKVTTPGDPGTVPSWNADLVALAPLTDLAAVTTGTTVTGATQASSDTGPRVVINDPAYPGQIVIYTGKADETEPARIFPITTSTDPYLRIVGPKTVGMSGIPATLDMSGDASGQRTIELDATDFHLFSSDTTIDGFTRIRLGDGTDYVTITGQAVTDADLSDPSNVFPASLLTDAGTETVTNKNLSDPSNVFPFKGGRTGITTDVNGRATITHGMSATPAWVVLTSDNTGTFWPSLVARTSTTFTVQINNKDAGVLASSAFTVNWFAGLF